MKVWSGSLRGSLMAFRNLDSVPPKLHPSSVVSAASLAPQSSGEWLREASHLSWNAGMWMSEAGPPAPVVLPKGKAKRRLLACARGICTA